MLEKIELADANMIEMNEALVLGSIRQHKLAEASELMNAHYQKEIIERKKVEEILRESEQRLRVLFDLQTIGVYSCDASGLVKDFNRCAAEIWGREPSLNDFDEKFCGSLKLFSPDGSSMPREQCPTAQVIRGEIPNALDVEFIVERPDGSRLNCIASIQPLKNEQGEITGAINCFFDVTYRKQAEERQSLLANEIAHRGKNLLAVVTSIINRSLSGSISLSQGRDALLERIQALARWQPIYSVRGIEGVPLRAAILAEMEVFSDRVFVSGPEVTIDPGAAQTFSLFVHELTTNACKYGSLSVPTGRVNISWSIEGKNNEARFKFAWRESSGPAVSPPVHKGFGRMVLERTMEAAFMTAPKTSFDPAGLQYEFDVLLSRVAVKNAVE